MTAFDLDRAVDVLARRQHGAFSRPQLTDLGGTPRIIRGRLVQGRWVQLSPSVFALTSHPGTWHRQLMAAVLGAPSAVVAGRAAAALHGLSGFRRCRPEVIVPRGSTHDSLLALVHESDAFRSTTVDAIPVLTLPDTLITVAACASPEDLRAALDDVLADGRLLRSALQRRYLDFTGSRRPGLVRLGQLIDERSADDYVPPESWLEARLYDVLDGPLMPDFRRQAPLPWANGQRCDAMLVDAPVILEADGRRWHTRVADLERDRRRDRLAAANGYHTLRFTHAELVQDADSVAREVRAVHRRLTGSPTRSLR